MGATLSTKRRFSLKRKLRRKCQYLLLPRSKQRFALLSLPVELQLYILTFLTVPQLLHCRRVCVLWRQLVDSKSLWKRKCLAEKLCIPCVGERTDVVIDYRKIYVKKPYGRNLVRNWTAKGGLNHWDVHADSGDHFIVEQDPPEGAEPLHHTGYTHDDISCWATSYGWCSKGQVIDLYSEGFDPQVLDILQPPIHISVWTASHRESSTLYVLDVRLYSTNMDVLHTFTYEHPINKQDLQAKGGKWIQVSHTFDSYGKDIRFVEFKHGGMDMQFWAGHYGPKMAAPSVVINTVM